MAMTFTLVSQLREQLSTVVRTRVERRKREEAEKERLALEVRISVGSIRTIRLNVSYRRKKREHEVHQSHRRHSTRGG